MLFVGSLLDLCVPTPGNSYRPRLLQKSSVAFFLALVLTAEGFYILSMFNANPSQFMLSAVAANSEATPGVNQVVRSFAQMVSNPMVTNWVIAAVVAVLGVVLVATVALHIQVQPVDLLLPGAVVVGIALFLLGLNVWYGSAYGIA